MVKLAGWVDRVLVFISFPDHSEGGRSLQARLL